MCRASAKDLKDLKNLDGKNKEDRNVYTAHLVPTEANRSISTK
jgi:hypothetical protein